MKIEFDFKTEQATIHVDKEFLYDVFKSQSFYYAFLGLCDSIKVIVEKAKECDKSTETDTLQG